MELHPPRRAALLKSVGKVLVSFGLLVLLLPALLFSLLLFAVLLSPVMIVGAVYLIGLEEELRFIGKWIGWVGEVEEKEQCGKKQEDKKEVDDEIQARAIPPPITPCRSSSPVHSQQPTHNPSTLFLDGGHPRLSPTSSFRPSPSPSPQHWPSPAISCNGAFSPVRIEVAVRQAMRDRQSANFSTELPSALRNLAGTNSFCSTDDEDDCEQEDSLSGFIVPHIDVRSLSDIRRQTLINEFKKVIAELEGTMEDRHPILPAPTPPPRPSAGMPRNRKNWTHTTPTVEDTRPATDGLYGADNADVDYWSGFDQAYDAAEKSFDSGSSSEDLRTQQWRAAMGKWVEKGVGVMKPLDEESLDSNSSFKTSPVGKKEVRWRDETATIDITSENDGSRVRAPADIEARYGLETPVRTVLGSSKHSNRVRPGSPALSSPAGSVSGKLIRMFEDMSRSEARSSPTLSGKGGDEGSMVAMVDGATEEPVEVGVLMEEVVEPEKVKLDNYKAGEEADGGF